MRVREYEKRNIGVEYPVERNIPFFSSPVPCHIQKSHSGLNTSRDCIVQANRQG